MAQTEFITHPESKALFSIIGTHAPAVGLFGYSKNDADMHRRKLAAGYIREIEQMPNFSPPSIENFVAHYVASWTDHDKDTVEREAA